MKIKYLALALWLAHAVAHAEGGRLGVEFESERDQRSGITNHAVTLAPGWEFSEKSLISRVELLIERNRDLSADGDGVFAKERTLFLRLRHDGEISERIGYYLRGGVGRSSNNERDFNYAYIEPGIEFKINEAWEWVFAEREINSIDGAPGKRAHKFYLGPNVDIGQHNELEFRYVKGSGDHHVESWLIEYVYKL
jgi:hypothetical protein